MYLADLHIHSRYSRATSRDLDPQHLELWGRRKGLQLIGTGDLTHAAWRVELREALQPMGNGLYSTITSLCRQLLAEGKPPPVLAGFNTADEVFLRDAVEAMGAPFVLATMDGSAGVKGLVTDAMADLDFTDICACGPLPMLKAIMNATDKPAQLSFEERMGCGFGACMGCTVKVKGGYKRICKDGPILDREEVIWEA